MIPPLPPARGPLQDGGAAELWFRYEDVAQDGRVLLHALFPGLGQAIWKPLLSKQPPTASLRARGILPILSRIIAVADPRPVSVDVPVRFEGAWRVTRERNGARLFLNMWLEAFAPVATTLGPPPAEGALSERVGRVFAEHVMTRPFAPPDERRVTEADVPELAALLDDGYVFEPAEQLGAGLALQEVSRFPFAMMHTDSNQHVNSLVYPRVFQEAVVQQVAGESAAQWLASSMELRFRKPFFAGQRAVVALHRDGMDVVGRFSEAGSGKLHTSVRLGLAAPLV